MTHDIFGVEASFFCSLYAENRQHVWLLVFLKRWFITLEFSPFHTRPFKGFESNPATGNSNVAQNKLTRMLCIGSDERVPKTGLTECRSLKPFWPIFSLNADLSGQYFH